MNDQASGQNPAQGWYTDPHDASKLRWWDGTGWTDHTHPPAGEAAAQPAAEPATAAQPAAAVQPTAAATPAAAAQPAAQPQSSAPGAGGIVSNPAPKAGGSAGGGEKGAVAQWFSVRSNQVLFLVLLVAIVLFIFVMAGGAS